MKKRHSSSSSQSSEISTKSKSVDSSLGGLSRSSTVASLDTDSTKSSGHSALDTCAEFKVKYLGSIERLPFDMCKKLLEPPDLINYLDTAQQEGRLPYVAPDEELFLTVSKHGIRVASSDQCEVLQRHPLYLVVRMLCYEDGLVAGRNLLALKTTDPEQQECSIWVYQCGSAEQAQAICKALSAAFDYALASDAKS